MRTPVALPANSSGALMRSTRDEIDETIARYRRLRNQLTDKETIEAADRLIAELEAKKRALYLYPDE